MDTKQIILNELKKYSINLNHIQDLHEIRVKDGIYLFRYTYQNLKCIIKYFEKEAYRREIYYYQLLNELNIPTIHVYDQNESSILLEDIEASTKYRLGIKEDLSHPKVALGLVKWYQTFHQNSIAYISEHPEILNGLYSEYDQITYDVIKELIQKLDADQYSYWNEFFNHFDEIKEISKKHSQCLTYNDFYYTNFIVSYDLEEGIMYDYNFLGKGFIYSDIRNVISSLQGEAKDVFLSHYQDYDPIEKAIDDVFSPLFSLYKATKRDVFPNWAIEEKDNIHNGTMKEKISILIDLLSKKSHY